MTVKEIINFYNNIENMSIREVYSINVMYSLITFKKHKEHYLTKDIENYCKYKYLLDCSKKLKKELEQLTNYGRNQNLKVSLVKVNEIYDTSKYKVDHLSKVIDFYDNEIEVSDNLNDLFI